MGAAYEVPGFKLGTLVADADLSTNQFHAVKAKSTEGEATLTGADALSPGVLQNAPELGEECEIMYEGVTKVMLGGTVAAGDYLSTDASSEFIVAVSTKLRIAEVLIGGDADELGTVRLGNFGVAP